MKWLELSQRQTLLRIENLKNGIISQVGSNVKDIQIGDHVGIGYYIDSCLTCEYCKSDDEVNCDNNKTTTCAGKLLHGRVKNDNGKYSYGGWSGKITANRRFVSKITKTYPLEKAGPIFCAGVTMFTPLKLHGASNGGLKVGVVGFGGLGQMGLLIAKAMGNSVTVISTSEKKKDMALKLGADHYIVSTNPESMKACDPCSAGGPKL